MLKPSSRVLLVVAGYLLALVIASIVVALYSAATSGRWSMVSPIRVLLAPVLAAVFFLCSLLAPSRATRLAFVGAGAAEAVLFVSVALLWFRR
jgi:hypothetical protein